jgi:hypothetical protein
MPQLKRFSSLCLLALVVSVLAASIIGPSSVRVQAQVANENPPCSLVMQNAEAYQLYFWTPGSNNLGSRSGWAWLACQGQKVWTTISSDPYYQAGHEYNGVAYQWGGWDTIAGFQASLNSGKLAGDTYDYNYFYCPDGKYRKPTFYDATGIDCSGFVTRVWGRTDKKYGTSTLPNISTAINFNQGDYQNDLPRKLRMGDIFNYVDNHVVLLRYFDPDDPLHTPYFYESNWGENRVVRSTGWDKVWPVRNDNTGYRPYRYNNIVDDAYLPDIKANYNGWNSIITIRNEGSRVVPRWGESAVQITFYDSNGNEVATATEPDLIEMGIWIIDASSVVGNNFSGSAVVASEYDVSVVVQNRHSSMITAYDGIGPATSTAPDPGFAKAASTLRLPLIMRNYGLYGHTWNTTIHIQNAGTATANVYVYFYNQNGTSKDTDGPYTIQPGTSVELNQANDTELGSSFVGTAKITSNRPVAATVNEVNTSNNRAMAYNAFSSGALDVYLPLSFGNLWDLNSEIPMQNIGSGSNVTVTYYEQGTSWSCDDSEYIGSNALYIFYPPSEPPCDMDGRLAAAVARNSSSSLIALLDERRDVAAKLQYMTYNGVAKTASMTSYASHVPILYRENYGTSGWQSSIQVQNIDTKNSWVCADFFNQSGDEVVYVCDSAAANRAVTFYLPVITDLGNNYVGSAVVEGFDRDCKVIAIANVQNFSMVGVDRGGGYNGFSR